MPETDTIGRTLGRAVGTPARVVLAVLTLTVGLLSAFGLALGLPPEQLTLASTASVVQSLMSVLVPFTAVLLAADLNTGRARPTSRAGPTGQTDRASPATHASPATRAGHRPRSHEAAAGSLAITWMAAALYAVGVGVFGALVSLLATLIGSGSLDRALTLLVAGPILQLVAAGVGTAFGLLIRARWLAMIATIAIPLGLWALLGLVGLDGAQSWLTPFAAAQRVFAAPMTPLAWVQWLVVALIWAVGLNAVGAAAQLRRLGRSSAGQGRPGT
jgi:hypothetical protein